MRRRASGAEGHLQITADLLRSSVQLSQPLRRLCDHVYSPLQFLLQVGDVHLVRDAIGVADALHIAVLDQFFETPHYGYAGQLQRVCDLTCAGGRNMTVRRKT